MTSNPTHGASLGRVVGIFTVLERLCLLFESHPMSALTDAIVGLTAAVTTLQAEVATQNTEIAAIVQLALNAGVPQAQIDAITAATGNITAAVTTMQGEDTSMQGALNPPPPPPAPAP